MALNPVSGALQDMRAPSQDSVLSKLVYYRRLARLPPGLSDALHGGFSLGAGNVWERLRDMRL